MPAQCSAVAQHNNSWILMVNIWVGCNYGCIGYDVWGLVCHTSPVCVPIYIRYFIFRPDIKGDYPPNLSILISGGKENNCDSLSNGE